jgi:hypothetical protein
VAVVPPAVQQRTVVRVTILNEKGDRIYSDAGDTDGKAGNGARLTKDARTTQRHETRPKRDLPSASAIWRTSFAAKHPRAGA